MDSEAETLSASVGQRRRTSSYTDDYSVQKTNDDATECKIAAVNLGYWSDPYISRFLVQSVSTSDLPQYAPVRRDPEISRGYWARIAAVRVLLDHFIEAAGPSCQILNLGAGFDTLYWRLKSDGGAKFSKYVEVDFSTVTAKKIRLIRKVGTPNLMETIASDVSLINESGHVDMIGPDFALLGADMRQYAELRGKLDKAGLDYSKPTVCICECVLIYMSPDQSSELVKFLADTFDSLCFINYEQVNVDDRFGEVMQKNLQKRGICLAGVAACGSIDCQKKRFSENGFGSVAGWSMQDIYAKFLPANEVARIERLEPLDEKELLVQLLEHYSVVLASKGSAETLMDRVGFQ